MLNCYIKANTEELLFCECIEFDSLIIMNRKFLSEPHPQIKGGNNSTYFH